MSPRAEKAKLAQTSHDTYAPTLTEKQWQAQVVSLAQIFGWRVFHAFDARRSEPGFPDLVLCRDRVLFVELKTDAGRLSDAQVAWINDLRAARALAYVWRPSEIDGIAVLLARHTNLAEKEKCT